MLLNAYTVFDNKALIYSPPFFVNTDGAAIRMLEDLVADPNTQVGRHPGDFTLFCVGTFSDGNASLEPTLPIRHIKDAVALVKTKTNPPAPLLEAIQKAMAEGLKEPQINN